MLENKQIKELSEYFGKDRTKVFQKIIKNRDVFDIHTSIENEFFLKSDLSCATLLVSSANQGEGTTTVSIILACLSAILDPSKQVLLIDSDCGDNGFLDAIRLDESSPGLYEVMTQEVNLEQAIQKTMIPNLSILTSKRKDSGRKALMLNQFSDVIDQARNLYNFIIVDSAAAGRNKSAPSVAKVMQNVVMVVAYGDAKREQIKIVLDAYELSQACVMGAIFNRRRFILPKFVYG
jgi:Mrp family chromosome partitioning ATPase